MHEYEVLGQQVVREAQQAELRHILGAAAADGFDLSSLVSAAAELSQKGVSTYEASQASDKSKRDQAAMLAKATTSDAAWASAEQMLELANQSHDPTRVAAAQALQQSAASTSAAASFGMTPDTAGKRVAAAQDAAQKAAQDSLANPRDAAKAALMRGWQKVAAAAGMAASAGAGGAGGALALMHGGGPSFFTKRYAGVPGWGWLVGGAVAVTGVALLIKAMRK